MNTPKWPAPVGDAPAWPEDAVEVARIVGAWGIKGALKVLPFSGDPQALFSSRRWFIAPAEGPIPRPLPAGTPRMLRVVSAKEHGDGVVATVHDLTDRDLAQALAGARVFVPRSSFPTPEADEYYWVDLIGLEVVNRQGDSLGRVEGLIETGPHCVLRLSSTDAEGQPRMIPFVEAYVGRVDLQARRIDVDWPSDY